MSTAAIIVAAGRGTRAGGDLPKQWQTLAGRRVADWTLDVFQRSQDVDRILLVIHPDDRELAADLDVETAIGGATRDASVLAGLLALEGSDCDKVLIHDVARPCLDGGLIARILQTLDSADGAAPALAVTDALWTGSSGKVTGMQDRQGLYRAQTPQGFRYPAILAAHKSNDRPAADDVEVARNASLDVAMVEGHENNLKITTPADFARAEHILRGDMDIRLGNGYDVHRFGKGDHVILCGVKMPHDRGLQGHSDADVGMHAVTDAIYGALAEGDIGRHFPPSDMQWKGAASDIFLKHAVELASHKGFRISNVDCTLICETPKIGPHAGAMRAIMAKIMGIGADRVSVKATTSEQLGFTGRKEGIAAVATATLVQT
ncbi:MAG: bifunctional 2-C-methyl-D-erythritol 4-phosphate cytidylyltransferase/2-C-methyl-D-erythritol 2,4-cyclodiphosphate synthase [Paracoccaceae bacterium]|jgi:2-C-methyl-D-erythritol 4-phosphate cytidylyltransferase/2-C-methyl-D-erythritol 2,4-cyclodiphosphate synthase|nr:bifunctional 2-C-methyl-D-erythritol 4-phosphate cytidylyltransferase/2-C-methyl-D-erythritol 2,4-cyclodiphosphate synthase [Paracoccaceae bacterium]MDP7184386.1 bifunctional 2-C-methyl-D-erythritol 4-phosphate cytidylyltransferase/2-C-methyl-D-erythritol 2,4-cyclodiphosphate synthase [Paracoccaceae bacterium]